MRPLKHWSLHDGHRQTISEALRQRQGKLHTADQTIARTISITISTSMKSRKLPSPSQYCNVNIKSNLLTDRTGLLGARVGPLGDQVGRLSIG